MTANDRKEVREMLHDILSGWQAANVAQADITNEGLAKIDKHLTALNGKVAEHEKIININLPHSLNTCAQKETIQQIRDNMISGRTIRNLLIVSTTGASAIVAIVWVFYKMFINPA